MEYLVTLIKDKGKYYKEGQKIGPIDIDTYNEFYNAGYINDEYSIIKKQTKKTKKGDNLKED